MIFEKEKKPSNLFRFKRLQHKKCKLEAVWFGQEDRCDLRYSSRKPYNNLSKLRETKRN